jgi:hypothetical protein
MNVSKNIARSELFITTSVNLKKRHDYTAATINGALLIIQMRNSVYAKACGSFYVFNSSVRSDWEI